MRKICLTSVLFVLLSSFLAASQIWAAPTENNGNKTVFRIGAFDRSSTEFASGNPAEKVNFILSSSSPSKDWFSFHPATLGSAYKSQESNVSTSPRAITFSLERSPEANYQLHIALLVESASVPAMRVEINGKVGMFYLHPKLDYSNGDLQGSFYTAYSSADIEFTFPGSYLRTGTNTITLQPVEEADEAVPDAGIYYDAIELDSASPNADSRFSTAKLVPTIFFQQENGELEESVEAFIRYSKPVEPASNLDLTIGKRHYHRDISGGHDFGEEKVQFLVGEFGPQTKARIDLKINGREEHYKQTIDPKKKWTVHVVPHIHIDIGYTDHQAKVAGLQSRAIDEAMNMTAQHPDFRFSLDGAWALQQFLDTRTGGQQQRAIEAIQKKQLFVPAEYANLLTGIASTETLIRSLYPSANFSRKFGNPLDYANITDVPSYSWSYASVLASAGIHYFAAAGNNYRAPVLPYGRLNENSPMWWVGPDGKRVFLWYTRHYLQMQLLFGLPPLMSAGRDTLPLFLQTYEHPDYHANAVILFGTQVENTDLFPQQAELAQKWNSIYAYPHLQYSGFHEALQDVEQQFGDNILTIHGDGGPYWEDGAGSDSLYLAMERWNEARGQTAEKFATLASLVNPLLKTDTPELGQMWKDMVLMDEHTWGSYNSVSDPASMQAVNQLAVKDAFAVRAGAQVDSIIRRSMADLANAIPVGPGSLVVFNSLNWKRSGLVSTDLNKGDEIVDVLTNQPVPFEILFSGKPPVPNAPSFIGSGSHPIRFLAQDVPPVGYKVYAVRQAQKASSIPGAEQSSTLESPYYKVQLDPETGAVRSIYDKQLQRELVSQESPYRFGEYLYVTGGDEAPNTILRYNPVHPKPALEVHPSHNGRIVSVMRAPYGQVARMESENLNTPSIKTEIRLFDHEKKIEVVYEVDKKEVESKEAAYFAFPFGLNQPQFQYEIQNGVVDPAKDMYPGAGHEWFSVQHWVSVQQDGISGTVMPLDAPLVTLGDINRGEWPKEFGKRPGTVFSYVMNNYWDTNYRAAQGGHFSFHYVITSAASTNAGDLSRMGWEAITPLEVDTVTGQDKAVNQFQSNGAAQPSGTPVEANSSQGLSGRQESLLDVEDPNVLLETWKPAEDGNGTILRFLDFGGTERTVTVRTPSLHLDRVWQTDAVERGQTAVSMAGDNQFHFTIHPHEIVTLRLVEGHK
jgi:alpha-mannosidase